MNNLSINSQLIKICKPFAVALSIFVAVISLSFSVNAQDGFDDEVITVHIKKIRDDESNYLRAVTKATAKEVTRGGEFSARLYKRNAKGPVIEVSSPSFSFAKYKDGMSTKEMATAGLSLVSEVGGMFGFNKEAAQVNEVNARINNNNSLLAAWGENEKVMVTMSSRVLLIDNDTGIEVSRKINYEQVFNSKSEFEAQKEGIIQQAVVGEVKKVLVEYLEDSE